MMFNIWTTFDPVSGYSYVRCEIRFDLWSVGVAALTVISVALCWAMSRSEKEQKP